MANAAKNDELVGGGERVDLDRRAGGRTAFIEPGSPWENGHIESFNARLHDEFLNGEVFYTLKEARVLIESWQRHYNAVHPHGTATGSGDDRHARLAQKPSMHQHSNRTSRRGQVSVRFILTN